MSQADLALAAGSPALASDRPAAPMAAPDQTARAMALERSLRAAGSRVGDRDQERTDRFVRGVMAALPPTAPLRPARRGTHPLALAGAGILLAALLLALGWLR